MIHISPIVMLSKRRAGRFTCEFYVPADGTAGLATPEVGIWKF